MNQNSTQPGTAEGAGRPAEWKGALSVDGRWHIELDSMEPCFEIGEAEGTCKVAIVAKSFPNAEGNARRIAAAWNACRGIPTEALEQGAAPDLLAACKEMTEFLSKQNLPDGFDVIAKGMYAISKAEAK